MKEARETRILRLLQRLAETETELQTLLAAGPTLLSTVPADAPPGSEANRIREEIQTIASRRRRLLDHLPILAFEVNAEGMILYANAPVAAATGYCAGELQEQDWFTIFFPREASRRGGELRERLKGGMPFRQEVALTCKDGRTLAVALTALAEKEGEKSSILLLGTDLSGQRQAEEALRSGKYTLEQRIAERTAELREANESLYALQEQRETYIHIISHELRTPLTVIQGHAQLLQLAMEGERPDDSWRESLNAILQGSERVNRMITDLVDAARLEGGQVVLEPDSHHLPAVIDTLLRVNRPVLDPGRIQTGFPPELPPILADGERLDRILLNLLTNALKYSPPDTQVRIEARTGEGEMTISIIDQGPGIPEEDLPHIFERFYRAQVSQRIEGVGLGLYITRRLVEAHEGRIWVECQPGGGSAFSFTLPITSP